MTVSLKYKDFSLKNEETMVSLLQDVAEECFQKGRVG